MNEAAKWPGAAEGRKPSGNHKPPVEKGQLGLPPEFQAADTSSIFVPCPYWGYRVSASGTGFLLLNVCCLKLRILK